MRPIIIGVGGAHSGAGKTTYASLILERLKGWGAIKYTKTGLYSSLVDDMTVLMTEGKDTRRMLDSGAEKVLWVQSTPSDLGEVLPMAVERLSGLRGIVVEGNSAIEFLKPDIIVFILGCVKEEFKESAQEILSRSDAVVSEGETPEGISGKSRIFQKSSAGNDELITYIEIMVEKKEKIRSSLKEKSVAGKISCHAARKIAEELDVPYPEVGRTADDLGIKVTACELGCF
ncbi:MAG TPA: hypothetical protein VFG09_12875 [Thermodesulfovibrionales bacterium]|nr:hypothetical protein [Thermodesulfovibrionales bacterium]